MIKNKNKLSPAHKIFALEPRLMFDGAVAAVVDAVVKAQDVLSVDAVTVDAKDALNVDVNITNVEKQTDIQLSVDSITLVSKDSADLSLKSEKPPLLQTNITDSSLQPAVDQAQQLVRDYLNSASDEQLFTLFNGGKNSPDADWSEHLSDLRQAIIEGSFTINIVEMDSASQFTAVAAYTHSGPDGKPTIFINSFWFKMFDTPDATRALVEELGHAIDDYLNPNADTPGDEGEIFAAKVTSYTFGNVDQSILTTEQDQGTVTANGINYDVEFASFTFTTAYQVVVDIDSSTSSSYVSDGLDSRQAITSSTDVTPNQTYEYTIDKESNNLNFLYTSSGLGSVKINDNTGSSQFSGNDVSVIVTIAGTDYYGWISRPIKDQGLVKAFYFWTDKSFSNLATAQADGNQDGDASSLDNRAFILVVDKSYFDSLAYISRTGVATNTYKVVGSSSDRVDTSLNTVVSSNTAPVASNDTTSGTPDASVAGRPALEQGYNSNTSAVITATINATGNVLSNDSDANSDALTVTKVGTSSATQTTVIAGTTSSDGTSVAGLYGTVTLGANGTYTYVVDNTNSSVNALQVGSYLNDTFIYTISDGKGGTASATLTIRINGSNDAPVAASDYNSAKEHTSTNDSGYNATGNLLTNDTDVDSGDGKSLYGFVLNGTATVTTSTNVVVTAGTYNITLSGSPSIAAGDMALIYTGSDTYSSSVTFGGLYYYDAADASHHYKIIKLTNPSSGVYGFDHLPTYYYDVASATYKAITDYVGFFTTHTHLANANNQSGINDSTDTAEYSSLVGGKVKEMTVNGASIATSGYTTLRNLSESSGTVTVGMLVSGPGVISGTTVSAITYKTDGSIDTIKLSNEVTSAQSGTFTFTKTVALANNVQVAGAHGTLTLNYNGVSGAYLYTPLTDDPNLSGGQSALEVFDYTMQDTLGVTSSSKLYITVYGSNTSDPVLTNDTGTAYEAGVGRNQSSPETLTYDNTAFSGVSATGNVLTNDTGAGTNPSVVSFSTEDGSTTMTAGSTLTGMYGQLTISSTGGYTYVVDDNNSVVKALLPSNTLTETFIYKVTNSAGGISYARLVITIKGTDDAPVASNDTGGTLTEDIDLAKSGSVIGNDSDGDANDTKLVIYAGTSTANTSVTSGTTSSNGVAVDGTYGRLMIGSDGTYTYTLGYTSSQAEALQALTTADSKSEVFTYKIADSYSATATATLAFTVVGTNEPPINKINGDSFSNTTATSFTTAQGTPLIFSGSKLLSVSDSEGDVNYVTLTVGNGTLSLTNTTNYTSATSGYATEYRKIDPNMIVSRPFRSPSIPHIIPPSSMPIICMFSKKTPLSTRVVPENPSACKLGTRTILSVVRLGLCMVL